MSITQLKKVLLALLLLVPTASQVKAGDWTVQGCTLVYTGPKKSETRCFYETRGRGVHVLSECPGAEKSGLLCYPHCRPGYTGVGPVCWQNCPPGYADDGALCRRNAQIIGADNNECPWYDKCGLTFARGCSKCPEGFTNDGCTCRIDVHIFGKDTYGRGVGSPMSCVPGREQIGLLCYDNCPAGFRNDGVVCTATAQTCVEVPLPPPTNELKPFCFRMRNASSPVTPCFTVQVVADTEANGRELARCQCSNCSAIEKIECGDAPRACS